jgi:two-component system cell cycle sensor histidine kinase/response regulator CckA
MQYNDVPATIMSKGEIGQVILNLLINAQHAMLDIEPKRITLTTDSDKDYVWLEVEDTGCGIEKENINKIFTPFFSTKGEHGSSDSAQSKIKGTGLGLSISHSIIEQHGGALTVESVVGKGSVFKLMLPLVTAEDAVNNSGRMSFGKGVNAAVNMKILVVDDEDDVRKIVGAISEKKNCEVFETDDGALAIETLKSKRFDLAFIDIKMPKVSGIKILEFISTLPEEKQPLCAIITGLNNSNVEEIMAYDNVFAVVSKPFELAEVSDILDEAKKLLEEKG